MGCDIDVRVLKHGRKCPKTGKQVSLQHCSRDGSADALD
jgi:hypothetical protein